MVNAMQLYLDFMADKVPLEDLLECMKQSSFYRFALFHEPVGFSQRPLLKGANTTDLTLFLSIDDTKFSSQKLNGIIKTTHIRPPEIRAIYNQRLFSSARIYTILTQLVQIIQNASLRIQESIGKIDLLTHWQRKVLPDPMKDLHW